MPSGRSAYVPNHDRFITQGMFPGAVWGGDKKCKH